MAEIKIEKKRPFWPWIIAVLLIAGLVYYVFLNDNQVQNVNTVEIESTTTTDTIVE